MALDVKVEISLAKPVGKAGTWFPLLYVIKGESETDLYGEYSNLDEVAAVYAEGTDAYKAANLLLMQDGAPDKVAILSGGDNIVEVLPEYINKGWRQLIVLGDFNTAVSTYIEATDKMYFTHFTAQAELEASYKTIAEYERTVCVLYTGEDVAYPEAAVVGATAGLKTGSFTYKNMIIKGVPALDMTDEAIEAAHNNGAITILEKAGDIVTSEGFVASGEYIDVIDSEDYVVQSIAYKVQKAFNNNHKVPYTDTGIALLESAVYSALVEAYGNGMIADNADGSPAYSTNFALRSQTTESDRADRNYPYGEFEFELAGAIHTAYKIRGVITV